MFGASSMLFRSLRVPALSRSLPSGSFSSLVAPTITFQASGRISPADQSLMFSKAYCTTPQAQPEEISFSDSIPILNPNVNVPAITDQECFAIVHLSGKQQKVCSGDIILTEKLVHAEIGDKIRLDKVLLVGTKNSTIIGAPRVQDAFVTAEVQEQTKAEKIIIFKKKRRKGYQRKRGFRAHVTVLRILDVHCELNTPESGSVLTTEEDQ